MVVRSLRALSQCVAGKQQFWTVTWDAGDDNEAFLDSPTFCRSSAAEDRDNLTSATITPVTDLFTNTFLVVFFTQQSTLSQSAILFPALFRLGSCHPPFRLPVSLSFVSDAVSAARSHAVSLAMIHGHVLDG